MASFAELPNELVSKILWQADPRDLESLSAIAKHVYRLAAPLLQEHRKLKRQYTSLEPPEVGVGKDVGNWFAEHLITILQNPRIALYVTDLHLTYWHDCWKPLHRIPDPADLSKYHMSYPAHMLDHLEHAVRTADTIPPDQSGEWITRIRGGDEDPIIALLLLHMPNLQTLVHDLYCQPSQEKVRKTIQHIVHTKNQSYLSQLRQVTVDYESRHDGDVADDCNLLQAYMLIPSVQSLHVRSLCITDASEELDPYYLGYTSNISELAFTGGFIGTNPLSQLITQTSCLQSFTWKTHRYCESYHQGPFDSISLSKALMSNASHTLESLTLRASGYKTTSLGSLHGFERLRTIDTDVALLFNADGSDILTWPKRLPPSLEKLSLALEEDHILQTPENFCEAFRCLLCARKDKTPHLKNILIRMQTSEHCREAYDHVQGPCSAAGILLHHAHPSGSGHMNAGCKDCDDCRSDLEQFLRESGGPQAHSASTELPSCGGVD